MLPSTFLNLPRLERAFLIASVQTKIDAEKKAQKEAERKAKKGKKGKKR